MYYVNRLGAYILYIVYAFMIDNNVYDYTLMDGLPKYRKHAGWFVVLLVFFFI